MCMCMCVCGQIMANGIGQKLIENHTENRRKQKKKELNECHTFNRFYIEHVLYSSLTISIKND